ncbi:DNA polymerase III subunit beta [Paenibacillus aurantiacus]|uniref:Beta sliding clamp n=1 Tax=Paenibacillus aurantiacus TaxID=1936118 RepID=A0ABV5KP46_9BACL
MNFNIHRNDLLPSLSKAAEAVDSRCPVPVMTGVYIEANEHGLRLVGSSYQVTIETHVSSDRIAISRHGIAVLAAKSVLEIVRKMPEAIIEVESLGSSVRFRSGRMKLELANYPDREDFNLPSPIASEGQLIDGGAFAEMVTRSVYAVMKEERGGALSGVKIDSDEDKLIFMATDRQRLAMVCEPSSIELKKELVIHGDHLKLVRSLLQSGDEMRFRAADDHVSFSVKDTTAHIRLMNGSFPRLHNIIPSKTEALITVLSKPLADAVERAKITAEKSTILFRFGDGEIEIRSKNEKGDRTEEFITVESIEGDSGEISLNARLLTEALKANDSEETLIRFTGQKSPFILSDGDESRGIHLLAPMATEEDYWK